MNPHPLITQLAEERDALDLTRKEVAEMAGIARATIDALDAGRRVPSLATLDAYAQALGYIVVLVRVGEKPCRECNEVKPVTAFGRDRRTRDGVAVRCGACVATNPAPLPRRRLEVAA